MKNLKTEVFNTCKRYSKKFDLDISASELSSLTMYSMLRKGYFEGSYDYIRLYRNEFNECSLAYRGVVEPEKISNDYSSDLTISMDEKDGAIQYSTQNREDLILQPEEISYINEFIRIIDKNKTLNHFIKDVNVLNRSSLKNKEIFTMLDGLLPKSLYNEIDLLTILNNSNCAVFTEDELINFNIKYKKDHEFYIDKNLDDCLRSRYDYYFDKLTGFVNYVGLIKLNRNGAEKSELIEYCKENNLIVDDIEYINKSKFLYEKSILKIIDDGTIESIDNFIDAERFEMIKKHTRLMLSHFLKNGNEKEIMCNYENSIIAIEKSIYKKYPLLMNKFNDLGIESSGLILESRQSFKNILNQTVFLDMNYKSGANFSLINGLSSLKYLISDSYNFKKTEERRYYNMTLNNGLEVVAIFDVILGSNIDRYGGGDFEKLKVLNIFNLCFSNRIDMDENIIKDGIQSLIDSVDLDTIISFEFTDAIQYSKRDVKKYNSLMKDVMNENKNRLFFSKCRSSDLFPFELRKIKSFVLMELDAGKISYDEVIKSFNYLDRLNKVDVDEISEFIRNNKSERVDSLDYLKKKVDAGSKLNKSKKIKV